MKDFNQNQSRFITIEENGTLNKYEKMTIEQYQCCGSSNAFYLDGAGKGRKYFKPLKSYIADNGRYEELYPCTIIFVEL